VQPDVSPLVAALRAPERRRLLDRAVPKALGSGDVLFLAGDRNRRAYIVASGALKLMARDGEGRETILGLALPGDLVGDVAALDELPQPLDAVAASRSELVGVDAGILVDVLGKSPEAALELARSLATRMRWVWDTAFERTSSDVPARLAGRLLDLADLIGRVHNGAVELELPLAQSDLGRLAGMCRESACRALRAFRAEGMVEYRGRRVRILRPDALERVRRGARNGQPSR
jgi:CRP/FNR family cyclic AMP-dependent transcriptional regulator